MSLDDGRCAICNGNDVGQMRCPHCGWWVCDRCMPAHRKPGPEHGGPRGTGVCRGRRNVKHRRPGEGT